MPQEGFPEPPYGTVFACFMVLVACSKLSSGRLPLLVSAEGYILVVPRISHLLLCPCFALTFEDILISGALHDRQQIV